MDETRRCPTCSAVLPPIARFCHECGAPQNQDTPAIRGRDPPVHEPIEDTAIDRNAVTLPALEDAANGTRRMRPPPPRDPPSLAPNLLKHLPPGTRIAEKYV